MLPAVHIAEKTVRVGETVIPLLSGEMHYWRMNPATWRPALERVREMGVRVVATYAPWQYHELQPGTFDFTGHSDPQRNLAGFLDLVSEMGFWIIFRPGPYIYSEWTNSGVTDAAVKVHRGSAEFQALARPWIAAVTELARPYQATRGGRIILWQADNEIDAWPHLYTEPLGLGAAPGPFQAYLAGRYGKIETLNTVWRSQYERFEDARAVSEPVRDNPALLARYHDMRAFLHDYANTVARWAVDAYREQGVDVPIVLNAYSGVSSQRWADFEAIADLAGCDIYPSREYRNRPGEQRHVLEAVRYAHSFSKLPYIAEFEAGIWHDWLADVGALTPNHYRLICLGALLAGAAGWNWYMLVNRDNWTQSPINEWGRARHDLFRVFQQITRLFDELDPATLRKRTHVAVTFDPLQRSTERPGQELLQSFYEADVDYDFFDVDSGHTNQPVAFYAGGSWLSERGQRRLLDYVQSGGHLVCVGAIPTQDEHLLPLNLLELSEPDGLVSAAPMPATLRLWEGTTLDARWWQQFGPSAGAPLVAERLPYGYLSPDEPQFAVQVGQRYTVGYTVERGQGRVTVVGLPPSPLLLLALHRALGIPVACRSLVGGVASALFEREGTWYLLATNDGAEAKAALFELAPGTLPAGTWTVEDMLSGAHTSVLLSDGGVLPVHIPAKDGVALRLSRRQGAS